MSHGIYDLSTKQFVRKKMRMWSVCDSQKANYDEKENFHEKKNTEKQVDFTQRKYFHMQTFVVIDR